MFFPLTWQPDPDVVRCSVCSLTAQLLSASDWLLRPAWRHVFRFSPAHWCKAKPKKKDVKEMINLGSDLPKLSVPEHWEVLSLVASSSAQTCVVAAPCWLKCRKMENVAFWAVSCSASDEFRLVQSRSNTLLSVLTDCRAACSGSAHLQRHPR